MQVGFIGLGKMGSRMVEKLTADGHTVIAWNRSKEPIEELRKIIPTLHAVPTIKELVESMEMPRVLWMMLPAGEATQSILDEIIQCTSVNDIIIDGGNAHFTDTEKRYQSLKEKGIKFLGIGVSGGILALTNGYPLMVGGDEQAFEQINPILTSLSKPNGHFAYFGTGGAGHFVKMVHNGIEYGQMQAIAEGFTVLKESEYKLNLLEVAKLWQKGTIVSGLLMDCVAQALSKNQTLEGISGKIPRGGEADWTIEAAHKENVSVGNISQAVDFRKQSETDEKVQNSFTAKLLNALREEFGGHSVKK